MCCSNYGSCGDCNYCTCGFFSVIGDEDDERDFVARNDKELARKELGLEWMLRSGSKVDSNRIQVDSELEKPIVEEVKLILLRSILGGSLLNYIHCKFV